MMTKEEFLKHIYHTRLYIIIPVLNRAKLDKRDFFNKKGKLDIKKLNNHLEKLYDFNFNKHERNMKK
jgi:hypothetical protein